MRNRQEIVLFTEERAELEKIVRAPRSEQRMVLRANIILLSSEYGVKNKDIARSLGISARVVGKWQQRYLAKGIDGLKDEFRSGRPSKLTVIQRAEIIAIACDFPRNYGVDTYDTWTIEELTKVANREVEGVNTSTSSVYRTLNKNELKPHKTQAWLHSKDPEFKEKTNEIVDLYINPPEGCAVVCVDEKPMQATEHKNEMKPAVPGNAAKVEYEYIRHGTQALIAGFDIENGHVTAQCGDTRKSTDLIDFMEGIAAAYTGYDKIHIVWDNLNIHHDGPDERWIEFNQRHEDKFVFHYTPLHASWVNQVEIFFSIVQRRVLKYGSFKTKEELKARVMKFIRLWNKVEGHAFHWTFQGYPMQSVKKEA